MVKRTLINCLAIEGAECGTIWALERSNVIACLTPRSNAALDSFRSPDFLHGSTMEAKLVVLDGNQKGKEIPLPETVFVIGRDARCHLRPHCPSVSKLHCAIASWAGLVKIQDLKSRNGTLLNGTRISGEAAAKNGDRLQIGTMNFEFRIQVLSGSPVVSPIRPEQIDWLLDATPDTQVLATNLQTQTLPVVTDNDLEQKSAPSSGTTSEKRGSKVVSAGQNLRDYLNQRRATAFTK